MPRTYRVPYTGTLTNAGGTADLFLLKPADDKPIRLKGFILAQTTEEGDAAEENIRITIQHFAATVSDGSGGSAPTPTKTDQTDPSAGFSARANDATVATTSGTATVLEELGWNVRQTPYERYIDEPDRPVARQGEALLIRCEDAVADDMTICITAIVEEL